MKKIMAVLTVLMCFASTSTFAQLKEVRGVQTRVIEYQASENIFGRDYGFYRHGFEFKNENNYSVWIEAELCTTGFNHCGYEIESGTRDTKSFTLNPGEIYVWKCGDKMIWKDCYNHIDYYNYYFVKYKAYKAE